MLFILVSWKYICAVAVDFFQFFVLIKSMIFIVWHSLHFYQIWNEERNEIFFFLNITCYEIKISSLRRNRHGNFVCLFRCIEHNIVIFWWVCNIRELFILCVVRERAYLPISMNLCALFHLYLFYCGLFPHFAWLFISVNESLLLFWVISELRS